MKLRKKKCLLNFIVITLIVGIFASCFGQAKADNSNKKVVAEKIDEYLTEVSKQPEIASLSVAVVKNGEIFFLKSYGLANVESKYPATPQTRYQIASVTKPFTAMAIMLLVEEGKIVLNEKAIKYLEWLPEKYREITVRQLLTHTSGVNRDLRRDNLDTFSEREFRRRLISEPLSFERGKRFQYSNTGYILLGMIVETVSGKSFEGFLNERIFKPLGMEHTKYYEPPSSNKNRALGYQREGKSLKPAPYFPGGFAAGGLVSSAEDLAKFALAFENKKLLKKLSFEQIFSLAELAGGEKVNLEMGGEFTGEKVSYGFGWWLTGYRGHRLYTHGGGVSGFQAIINRFPDEKIAIIVLANTKTAGVDRIASRIADIVVPN